jgi:hypothetical protein
MPRLQGKGEAAVKRRQRQRLLWQTKVSAEADLAKFQAEIDSAVKVEKARLTRETDEALAAIRAGKALPDNSVTRTAVAMRRGGIFR